MRKYLLPLAFTLLSTICFSQNDTLSHELDVVIIDAKSDKEIIEQSGFAVNVIQTREAGLRNLQTNELLDKTVGVRIRQNGGLGSDVKYNINGMSGNAVRIFIDGIPISTYGSSFDLNSIPPAMIERIEIYKGVVPGHLADDALGGAINIVLKKGARNNFNASASYGSFNTTQANFNGLYRFEESGFTIKASGFYNYSDNDYEVWGKNVYVILPNGRYEYIRAKRFNDAYESVGGVLNLGFTDVKWADNFTIGFTRSDAYNEVQHGTFMTTPYKGRFTESDASLFNLTYNKKDFLTEGLEFNFHGIYGQRNRMINDTVKWNYNWYGEQSLDLNGQPIIRPQGAQQGAPTLANIKRNVASIRTGLSYAIHKNHQVMFNYNFSDIDREDDDAMKSVLERQFVGTRDLQKHITSLSYQFSAFNDKLKTSVFGKNYNQTIERMNPIVQTINGQPTRVEDVVQSKKDINGYGITLSYALYPKIILLSSAERGVRLPNEDEVFGDAGDNISENPNIRPETSKNFNLGFRLGDFDYKKHRFGFNINGFYRNITDRIGTPVQTALNSNVQTLPFVNQGNVTSKGIDFEFQYSYDQNLKFVFNTSKLDLTTKDVYGREKNIPNEPFLTANASVQYSFDRVGGKDAQLNLYYNFMYVDSFSYISPLYSNNAGTDFFDIPEQFVNDLGVSYRFPNRKFIVSFDAKNIFDKQAFDNFAVQKPGRAFYLKLNYVINNF
jgi:outer membrane receptor protein involved in Fe transport